MGNCLGTKPQVEPTEGVLNEEENREVKSVVTRRATKGAGVLGKTSWSDDEDEDEDEEAEEEVGDIVGQLPQMDAGDDAEVITSKTKRTTLIAKPQMIQVDAANAEQSLVHLVYIPNISQEDIQSKQSDIERAICEGKTAEIESRICIYNGQLKTEHNSLQIDAAIATDEVPESVDNFPILSRQNGCQLICQKGREKLGLLALDKTDESGEWLEFVKSEAVKMMKDDQPNMIVAVLNSSLADARKLAACNISSIKCILCADEQLPNAETVELGTVIISLNSRENKVAKIPVTFDEFHQPEFGAANFIDMFSK